MVKITDIFNRALLTSDPVILQKFKEDLLIRQREELRPAVQALLLPVKQMPTFMDIDLD